MLIPTKPLRSRRGVWRNNVLLLTIVIVVLVVGVGTALVLRGHRHGRAQAATAGPAGGYPGNGASQPAVASASAISSLGPSPASDDDEYGELSGIEDILNSSVSSRKELHSALQNACEDPVASVSAMHDVIDRRSNEIADAQALDLSAVPDGDDLGVDLVALLQTSATADRAYATYVKDVAKSGCSAGKSAFERGNALSVAAQNAKVAFFGMWTPLAEQNALTPHDATDV